MRVMPLPKKLIGDASDIDKVGFGIEPPTNQDCRCLVNAICQQF